MFKPIIKPYMTGFVATRADGIDVEVVKCYSGQWNVFLTRNDHVVACSIEEHKLARGGYLSYATAKRIAKSLLK
jgi:hypothetical protein